MELKKPNKKKKKDSNHSPFTLDAFLSKWLSLIIGLIALATSIFNLTTSIIISERTEQNSIRINEQGSELDYIKNCKGEVAVLINTPETGDQVASPINVSGTSIVHESCRYVFLFVHDKSAPGKGWQVADLVQVNLNGNWSGKVSLDSITLGAHAEIDVRITAQPKDYIIGQIFSIPPDKGIPSNIVDVRRIK